jgi:hypothetical protein
MSSDKMYLAVKKRVEAQWRDAYAEKGLALTYDRGTFDDNLAAVNEDADAGRIRRPKTDQQWVEAVVEQFSENTRHGLGGLELGEGFIRLTLPTLPNPNQGGHPRA